MLVSALSKGEADLPRVESMSVSEKTARRLLESSGIEIGGSRSWDIRVHDERLYDRILSRGTLGLGEAYVEGWWDAKSIDEFIFRLVKNHVQSKIQLDLGLILSVLRARVFNLQRRRVFEVGQHHYDLSNKLYGAMLDKRMIYSCAYWEDAKTLDDAQEAKLDLICKKIGLKEGQHILDVGAGWGGLLKFAAERYGISGIGVTVSKRQAELASASFGELPLKVELKDYMEVEGKFDHILSVGMFEHVGYKNYHNFMKKMNGLLKDDGLLLLHTIGGNTSVTQGDPWTEKYIFPNGMLPSPRQISSAAEGRFVMEDWHNFGAHYDLTLMAWHKNFEASWPELKLNFDERFYRMWRYYLLSYAGVFRAREIHLWQIVFSKNGVPGGYKSIR